MAQLNLNEKSLLFKIIYFGRNTQENLQTIEFLQDFQQSDRIQLLPQQLFFLPQFDPFFLPNVGEVHPLFELIPISNEDLQNPQKIAPFHLADALVFVVNPKNTLKTENIQCFEDMVSCLKLYQRSLETISFLIQYTSAQDIDLAQLNKVEKELRLDEFVGVKVNLNTGEGILETLEEIVSDIIDEFSSNEEEAGAFLDTQLLVQPSSASIHLPKNPLFPQIHPSLPLYQDIPPAKPDTTDFPKKEPPFYGDLPQQLPSYGDPSPKFPQYGNPPQKNPKGFDYGLPPAWKPDRFSEPRGGGPNHYF